MIPIVEEIIEVNCGNLKTGLIYKDQEKIRSEFDKLTDDFSPNPTAGDPRGQSENLIKLSEQILNTCKELELEVLCYACIKTNPPQSEILFQLDSADVKIERVIDISTPSDNPLRFLRTH